MMITMIFTIQNALENWLNVTGVVAVPLAIFVMIILILLLAWIANAIAKRYLVRLMRLGLSRARSDWADVAIKHRLVAKIAHFIPAIIIHFCAGFLVVPNYAYSQTIASIVEALAIVYALVNVGIIVTAGASTVEGIYNRYPVSKRKPIKTYLQVFQLTIYIALGVTVLAVLLNTSPWTFFTGLGAATAVIILVFKDSILGFVASIQLSSYDMVRIGDWIEMPNYGADGDVTEISLGTIKVRNFDKTISTIPTSSILTSGIKNWRGMQESGGRRIKRAINLDQNTIKYADAAMLERAGKIEALKPYLENKRIELEASNGGKLEKDPETPVNGRRHTNVGLYRAYMTAYLSNHPEIYSKESGYTFLVRQLAPGALGLPIEVYVFSKKTDWPTYESIQADVMDHLLAALPIFELKSYQGIRVGE